jgi:hypothetical protein
MLYLYTYILNEFFFFKFLVEKSVFVGYVYIYIYVYVQNDEANQDIYM